MNHSSYFSHSIDSRWHLPWRGLHPGRISLSYRQGGLVLGALILVGLILIVPAYLLVRMAGAQQSLWDVITNVRIIEIVGNTVLLAMAVTGAAAVLALTMAWLTVRTDLPCRRVLAVVAALPLVVPSYVAAYLFVSVWAPKGLVQQLLAPWGITKLPSLYGFSGAFIVLTLITYPYIYLTVRSALKRLDPALAEAARSLGRSPWQVFWQITLPHLRPALLAGGLLVALYVLRDFGVVTMLQFSTFTRIIYNRYLGFQLNEAAVMATMLVLVTAVFLWLEARARGRAQYARLSVGVARQQKRVALGIWRWPAFLFVNFILTLALFIPAGGLFYWFWRGVRLDWVVASPGAPGTMPQYLVELAEPAWHSLSASLFGAAAAMLLALPVVVLSVRYKSRISLFLHQATYASFALPGIVVALALVFFGTQYARTFYQTLPMLVVAYVILFVPQAIGAERAALLQVSRSLEEAGRSLGKRPFAVFQRVTLPLIWPGMIAGGILVFLTIMKELPATLILSPLGFSTLAAQIWTHINEAFFARAAAPTLLLLLLSSIPLAVLTMRERKL